MTITIPLTWSDLVVIAAIIGLFADIFAALTLVVFVTLDDRESFLSRFGALLMALFVFACGVVVLVAVS